MDNHRITLGSDVVVHAARVIRLVRQSLDLPAGVRVLALIDQHGPQTITALAQADGCSQPTMSGTVSDLVAREWVGKQPHPTDARSCVVGLTDRGRAALNEIRRNSGALIAQRLWGHTPEEIATAVEVLRAITEAAPDGSKEPQ